MFDVITAADLDRFKGVPVAPGYPPIMRTLWSPGDQVHAALVWLLSGAQSSMQVAMYEFDDDELADILKTKLADPDVFVQVTLDESQALNPRESRILKREDFPNNSVAIGCSELGAIVHLKLFVIDNLITVTGSCNWSPSAEIDQDNALVVIVDSVVAAEAGQRMTTIHTTMLARNNPRPSLTSWWRRVTRFVRIKLKNRSQHWTQ